MKVLFADDDIEDHEFFIDALSYVDAKIQCLLARNCEHAISMLDELLDQELPAYIFLDIHMPVTNGMGCLTRLKNSERYKNIKVVMYSTSSDPTLIAEYKKLGATYFLIKPQTFPELCDSLSILFGK